MSKKLLLLSSISFLALPVVVLAQEVIPTNLINTPGDIVTIIDRITSWIFTIFLAAAIIFIIMAAIQFLTSGGDAAKVSTARNSLLYALIGIAVAFLAKGFVAIVKVIISPPVP